MTSPIPSRGVPTSTERLHDVIGKLRDHIVAIQAAKVDVDAGRDAPEINPILACINDLPAIVRELDMAELEIEADFEAHEDRQALFPVEAANGSAEFELFIEDSMVAGATGKRDFAIAEIRHYAAMYAQDFPEGVVIHVEEIIRIPSDHLLAASPPLAEGQDGKGGAE